MPTTAGTTETQNWSPSDHLKEAFHRLLLSGSLDLAGLVLDKIKALEAQDNATNAIDAREEAKKQQAIEYAKYKRLRHVFVKVTGVTFPNDNGTERQAMLRKCVPNEQLILRYDAYNECSMYAIQVLRKNGDQLGHTPSDGGNIAAMDGWN